MEKRAGLYDWSLGNNNELHRLIGGTHLGQALLFDYDANSNRLFSSVDGEQTDLVVDTESNQITQVGDNTLDYDLNGNIILDGVNAYGYDAKNRFTNFNNGQVFYTHNAFGLRVKKTFPANAPNAAQSTGNHIEDDFTGSDDTDILTRADNTWASNGKGSALIKGNQANLIDGIALSQSVGTLNEDDSYSLNAKLTQGEISVSSGGSEIVNVRYGFGRNLFITAQGLDEALNVNTSIYKDKLDVNVTWKAGEVVVTVTGTDGTEHTTGTITNSNIKEGEAQSVQLRDYFSGFYTQIFGKTVFIDDVTVVGSNTPTTPEPVNNDRLYHYNDAGLLTTEFDGDGNILLEHVYLGSTPVAVIKDGTTYFVHVDHLGTPRSITRQNNTVVWGWESKPFGDDAVTDLIGLEYNIRMAGQYEDSESGLFYNWNRTYSPKTGRYLESDPIGLGGGLNTYGYVGGNPNSFTDPKGLQFLSASNSVAGAPVNIPYPVSGSDIKRLLGAIIGVGARALGGVVTGISTPSSGSRNQSFVTLYRAPHENRLNAATEPYVGYSPIDYPGEGPFFTDTLSIAVDKYQYNYRNGLQVVNILSGDYQDMCDAGIILEDFYEDNAFHVPAVNLEIFNGYIMKGPPNYYVPEVTK